MCFCQKRKEISKDLLTCSLKKNMKIFIYKILLAFLSILHTNPFRSISKKIIPELESMQSHISHKHSTLSIESSIKLHMDQKLSTAIFIINSYWVTWWSHEQSLVCKGSMHFRQDRPWNSMYLSYFRQSALQ